jgi:hypothetical protein
MNYFRNDKGVFAADSDLEFKGAEKIDEAEYEKAISQEQEVLSEALNTIEKERGQFIEQQIQELVSSGLSETAAKILVPQLIM